MLQQASNLTNGFYFKVTKLSGLLNYLLWLFLPEHSTRKMLVYPPKTQVDFRAACFCHRKLIDVGYVCSVCLSVFCSFTPICSTCNCNFQFDIGMLKKASLLKQISGKLSQQQNRGGVVVPSPLGATSNIQKKDDFTTNRLTTKFQDTSLSSPLNPILMGENLNDIQPMDSDSQQGIIKNSNKPSSSSSNQNKNINESLDMLE